MNSKLNRLNIVTVCETVLLLAAAVAVVAALRSRRNPAPPPEVPVAQTPAEVRVKAVERKTGPVAEGELAAASGAVAIVCGADEATADSYEARNDADERTWLTDLIQRTAAFSGVKLMSYSVIMSNHFTYSSISAVRRRCATRRS